MILSLQKYIKMPTKMTREIFSSKWQRVWMLPFQNFFHNTNFCVIPCFLSHSGVWPFVTPWTCSPPGSSIYKISQASILEWVAISFSRVSSKPMDQTHVSCSSYIGRQILCHWTTWEPLRHWLLGIIFIQQGSRDWNCFQVLLISSRCSQEATLSSWAPSHLPVVHTAGDLVPWVVSGVASGGDRRSCAAHPFIDWWLGFLDS